jgi:hypothetical protein
MDWAEQIALSTVDRNHIINWGMNRTKGLIKESLPVWIEPVSVWTGTFTKMDALVLRPSNTNWNYKIVLLSLQLAKGRHWNTQPLYLCESFNFNKFYLSSPLSLPLSLSLYMCSYTNMHTHKHTYIYFIDSVSVELTNVSVLSSISKCYFLVRRDQAVVKLASAPVQSIK